MRRTFGACVPVFGISLAGGVAAIENTDGWGPFRLDMTLPAFRALHGFD